jgi:hypothetical protein
LTPPSETELIRPLDGHGEPAWLRPWLPAIDLVNHALVNLDNPDLVLGPDRGAATTMRAFLSDRANRKDIERDPARWACLPYFYLACRAVRRLRDRHLRSLPAWLRMMGV